MKILGPNSAVMCVLRSGGEFGPQHVERLQKQLSRVSDIPLVCFSDVEVPCRRIPLLHSWPRWWPKLEMFRYSYPDPVLYMDLDTTILKDPEPLFSREMSMLQDVYRRGSLGSGLMSWSGDLSHIYHKFLDRPEHWMEACSTRDCWGDQGFISLCGVKSRFIDPSSAVSYKAQVRKWGGRRSVVPSSARVVYFHGKPRPWEVPELVND
jgi:hypothetical protein